MGLTKENSQINKQTISNKKLNSTKNRRTRRNKLRAALTPQSVAENKTNNTPEINTQTNKIETNVQTNSVEEEIKQVNMSANENKSRGDVLAARQAKKLAKQKGKGKDTVPKEQPDTDKTKIEAKADTTPIKETKEATPLTGQKQTTSPKSKDEVDKAVMKHEKVEGDKDKELIKAERAAKKAAKQAKKKGAEVSQPLETKEVPSTKPSEEMTVKDVVETLRDIVNVAKEIKDVTVKVNAMDLGGKKSDEANKSKAELKAERRAKQEAQRAAKQAVHEQQAAAKPKTELKPKAAGDAAKVKEASPAPKQKPADKAKPKPGVRRVNWLQHLYTETDKEALKTIAINSNLHPAIVKLGVQLASRVVTGSNARCVALLDALKKMVRDYTLPAKTEFGRGLESHLAASLEYLWAMQPPSASQTNAVKFFRYHITQLPNNVDEFDAKKTLQEEIDRYIREQIDMAGEAISIAVRNKIANDDVILTYGCSSLIERILRDAWAAGLRFRTVVAGQRVPPAAADMLRRLVARGLPCTYVDITALAYIMSTVKKVLVGAECVLANGAVVGAAGAAQLALAARARGVPLLVAAETHKFADRVHTDAILYEGIGDPDDLIDKTDENSPLKDWRSNPNLTPLNLTYDVTPPSLVTALVTELAILPCTSAPVVLRFKLSEYGIQG